MHETYINDDGRDIPTPEITDGLLAYLECCFSIERFKSAKTEQHLHDLVGQFKVIDHLKALHAYQNNPQDK